MSSSGHRRFSRAGRFGLNRPSLDSMKTTRRPANTPPPPAAPADTDAETDGYYDSEEEEEALLSRRHGEAMEDNAEGANKRSSKNAMEATGTDDQDILNEYKAQEEKKKRRRKAPSTLTPEMLISKEGLSNLRHAVAPKFHTSSTTGKPIYNKTPASMAKYSRHLVAAYRRWMDDLSGGIPLEEAMWKVQALYSKTQVKQYVQEMRNQVRNEHVERTLGLEKAEQLLSQLDDFYQEQQYEGEGGGDGENGEAPQGGNDPTDVEDTVEESGTSSRRILNPYEASTNRITRSTMGPAVPAPAGETSPNVTDGSTDAATLPNAVSETAIAADTDSSAMNNTSRSVIRARHVLQDSDDEDEMEANFDTEIEGSRPPETSQSSSKRRVLEDDEEELDDDDIEMDATKTISKEHSQEKDEEEVAKTLDLKEIDSDGGNADPVSSSLNFDEDSDAERTGNDAENSNDKEHEATDLLSCPDASREAEESLTEEPVADQNVTAMDDEAIGELPTQRQDDASPAQPEDFGADEEGFNDFPLTQASEAPTILGTQFTQDSILMATQHSEHLSTPMESTDVGTTSATSNDDHSTNLSQESEVPTVLATQGMTQEWMTQNEDANQEEVDLETQVE
jgi:Replication Fork Protection Component Swi3